MTLIQRHFGTKCPLGYPLLFSLRNCIHKGKVLSTGHFRFYKYILDLFDFIANIKIKTITLSFTEFIQKSTAHIGNNDGYKMAVIATSTGIMIPLTIEDCSLSRNNVVLTTSSTSVGKK